MTYQIIERGDPLEDRLSQFVRNSHNCHFLQDPSWGAVKIHWKWSAVVVQNAEGEVCGIMSVLLRILPMGFHIAYAPRGPVCDRNNRAVLELFMEGLNDLANRYRCLLTYLDPDEPEENESFRSLMKGLGYHERRSDSFGGVQPQSVFRLSLKEKDENGIFASFAQKTRYNIRIAQKRGVSVERYPGGSPIPREALTAFDALMQTTGERDHFLVRNAEYFERLLTSLGNDGVLYLAFLNGEPIAGSLAIFYGEKAWYLYGASANEHRGTMPNYLLQWTMICDALHKGCVLYDFRGVPGTGEPSDPLYGLYRFKKGFAGVHTRFTGLFVYYHKPLLGKQFDRAQTVFRKLRNKYNTSANSE